MRYMRCKCGAETCWTSMGHPECDGCDECHTTLAESPGGHTAPIPHDWREEWKRGSAGAPPQKERICVRCMRREDITDANAHAVTVYVDGVPLWMQSPKATGLELKVARRIDPLFTLCREAHGMAYIADDDTVALAEGDRFMSAPPGHF